MALATLALALVDLVAHPLVATSLVVHIVRVAITSLVGHWHQALVVVIASSLVNHFDHTLVEVTLEANLTLVVVT